MGRLLSAWRIDGCARLLDAFTCSPWSAVASVLPWERAHNDMPRPPGLLRHTLVSERLSAIEWPTTSVERARALLADVAATLTVIHGRGVAHRDVKLEHVMLRRGDGGGADRAVLIDVEWACRSDDARAAQQLVVGTAGWMPPETFVDDADAR